MLKIILRCKAQAVKGFCALVIATILFSAPVFAQKPVELSGRINSAQPFSAATFSWLFFDVYDAALWMDAKKFSYQVPFALQLTYHRAFTGQELVERTLEEMQRAGKLTREQYALYKIGLITAFPDVKEGDSITAVYHPRGETVVFHNGEETARFDQQEFSTRFFNVWLGEATSAPSLRKKLLHL